MSAGVGREVNAQLKAVFEMNTLYPGFGLVLLLFLCIFFLTDEILWDAWENTCWTISTASTGTRTASDLRCLFTTQSQAGSQAYISDHWFTLGRGVMLFLLPVRPLFAII